MDSEQQFLWMLAVHLARLPMAATIGALVLWGLRRLHSRPRAGWTVILLAMCLGFQLFGLQMLVETATFLRISSNQVFYEVLIPGWNAGCAFLSVLIWCVFAAEIFRQVREDEAWD